MILPELALDLRLFRGLGRQLSLGVNRVEWHMLEDDPDLVLVQQLKCLQRRGDFGAEGALEVLVYRYRNRRIGLA